MFERPGASPHERPGRLARHGGLLEVGQERGSMLNGLENVRWDLETQPSWNTKAEVAEALRALSLASLETGDAAYSRMLYALGNNQAGTH